MKRTALWFPLLLIAWCCLASVAHAELAQVSGGVSDNACPSGSHCPEESRDAKGGLAEELQPRFDWYQVLEGHNRETIGALGILGRAVIIGSVWWLLRTTAGDYKAPYAHDGRHGTFEREHTTLASGLSYVCFALVLGGFVLASFQLPELAGLLGWIAFALWLVLLVVVAFQRNHLIWTDTAVLGVAFMLTYALNFTWGFGLFGLGLSMFAGAIAWAIAKGLLQAVRTIGRGERA